MTLLQLIYFKTLAKVLHYTHAAQELHISQPSLSYSISELEKELGVKLFVKEKRNIQLTEYGQRFLPYVNQALQALDNGKAAILEMTGDQQQTLSLGYFHSIAASLIPSIIESFYQKEANRKIHFQFIEDGTFELYTKVRKGDLELAFSTSRGPEVDSALIMKQPLYLTVPIDHPLAKKESVVFDDFYKEPFIVLTRGSSLRDQMDRLFASRGKVPKIVFEVQECNAALQYVALNFGVAILPEVPGMKTSRVVTLPIAETDDDFVRNVYLLWNSKLVPSTAAGKVKDYIIEKFAL